MTDMKKSDMLYKDYSWTAVPGDDPTKTKEDRDRFSRKEGYEVLTLINSFTMDNKPLSLENQRVVEWMIHEKLPGSIQGRANVTEWIKNNFSTLKPSYPR